MPRYALKDMGYISYALEDTKQLAYRITDWVVECSGEECMDGTVYATPGYGFLCMPRNITERLVAQGRKFEETDAWLDMWCHIVFRDYGNAFSFLSPVIQYGKYDSILTLETLGLGENQSVEILPKVCVLFPALPFAWLLLLRDLQPVLSCLRQN